MDTEKVCVNLTPLEIGKIDTLVAQGAYTTRTDVIRAAIRILLEQDAAVVDQGIHRVLEEHARLPKQVISGGSGVGVFRVSKEQLEAALEQELRVRVAVIGMAILADEISPELADAAIDRIRIFGSLRGPKAVLDRIGARISRDIVSWD